MFSNNKIYALHDSDDVKKRLGAFEIDTLEAEDYNEQGFGIFWTVNEYDGARKIENITNVKAWFADIDDGTKEEQMARIMSLPRKPSMVIETKNGYHCYWLAEDATIYNFKTIVKGLIKRLKADPACKDAVRLLRCPHYNHMKNPNEPFPIKIVYKRDKIFTEAQMLNTYKIPTPKLKVYRPSFTKKGDDKDWWLDQEERNKRLKPQNIVRGVIDNTMRQYFLWARDDVGETNAIKIMQELNQDIAEPMNDSDFKRITRRN